LEKEIREAAVLYRQYPRNQRKL